MDVLLMMEESEAPQVTEKILPRNLKSANCLKQAINVTEKIPYIQNTGMR